MFLDTIKFINKIFLFKLIHILLPLVHFKSIDMNKILINFTTNQLEFASKISI